MNFRYTIEKYNELSQKLFVLYYPEDVSKPVLGEYFTINSGMTEYDIDQMIINGAPIYKWNIEKNTLVENLIGKKSNLIIQDQIQPAPEAIEHIEAAEEQDDIISEDELIRYRNNLLRVTDKTQLTDYKGSIDRQVWAEYRQSLRDITKTPDWPNPKWPESPDEKLTSVIQIR